MKVASLMAALLIPASLFASVPPQKRTPDLELATVNGLPIGSRELLDVFTNRHGGHARFLGGNAEARTFLNIVIEDHLLVQEAYNIGLDADAYVQKLVTERETSQAGERLIKDEIDAKSTVTKEEVRATWEKELNFVVQGRQIAVDSAAEAEEARNSMLHGGDVEALARACSRADSRFHDGRFVASWGQYDPEWERVVFALQPGEVSPAIATRDGYEVIMLESRIETPRPDLGKVSARIDSVLHQRRLEDRKKAWSEELWRKYQVELAPLDRTPLALRRLLSRAPETVIATWNGGGKLTLRETFNDDDLAKLNAVPPARASYEIDTRIRTTVNDPLVALEAAARKVAEVPEVADEVQRYREYLMEAVLFRDHIFRNVTVSDEDVRKYYDQHRSDFVEPEQRHVAQILVATEAQANDVKAKLAAGADFEELVRTRSRDMMTAGSGGDLGWITAAKVSPSFAEVLKLAAGETAKPIQTASGWHIIKIVEIRPSRQLAVEEVNPQVREKALDERKRAARSQWIEKLRAAAKIEIHDAAVRQFVKENEARGEAPPQHGMQ